MGRAGGSWSVQAMGRKSANPYGIRVGALTSVEVRGGMRKVFIKDICNILLLSLIPT